MIPKWIYHEYKADKHTGKGYIQGTGFDVQVIKARLLGIEFIKDITISVQSEWIRDLKDRLVKDNTQQELEGNR